MTEPNSLPQGLRDTATWIRARDRLATNYIYCVRAAEVIEEQDRVIAKLTAELREIRLRQPETPQRLSPPPPGPSTPNAG